MILGVSSQPSTSGVPKKKIKTEKPEEPEKPVDPRDPNGEDNSTDPTIKPDPDQANEPTVKPDPDADDEQDEQEDVKPNVGKLISHFQMQLNLHFIRNVDIYFSMNSFFFWKL